MANFQKAPADFLKHPAHYGFTTHDAETLELNEPGTYTLGFDDSAYVLNVPLGNDDWKGRQTRLVGQWGGAPDGSVLVPTVADDSIVEASLLSTHKIGPHLWLYKVRAKSMGSTNIEARVGDEKGPIWASLTVQVLPEEVDSPLLPAFDGGTRAETVDAIIAECRHQGLSLNTQIAYVLATVEHESGFQPIREGGFLGERKGERHRRGLRYYPYYGRGYVQLTHRFNYDFYGNLLSADMVDDPDLALQPAVALFVVVHGMRTGKFTGASLPHFVSAHKTDFVNARRVVNGLDKAEHIAHLAQAWLRRLSPPAPAKHVREHQDTAL
jgi:predicted chitinase